MFCTNCGKEILTQDEFCSECGSSINVKKSNNEITIKKTKLGITVPAFAALTFLSGLVSFLVVALMAWYALTFEEDEILKKNVLKAVIFIIVITVLNAVVGSLDNILAAINGLLNSLKANSSHLQVPLGTALSNILTIIEKFGLIIFAFRAFKGTEVKISFVDDYVNKSL